MRICVPRRQVARGPQDDAGDGEDAVRYVRQVDELAGIALGTGAGLLLTRLLQSMLNDVKPTDPSVYLVNAALVLAVSMAACYIPARWAGRVDPAVVLRID